MNIENIAEPERLTESEYLFLSENLDVLDGSDKNKICCFVAVKRKVVLSRLLHVAIDNELSDIQRKIINMIWFEGLTATEAAKELGVNKSTVTRQSQKAYDKLRNSLKYVMLYQFDDCSDTVNYFREALKYDQRH